MKCVVLGFDGLDYDIVKRLNLKGLKQKEYGKVRIPKECYIRINSSAHSIHPHYEPWTPLIWYSLLTGELPLPRFRRDMEVGGKWKNVALNTLEVLSIRAGLGDFRGIRILKMFGFQKKLPVIQDYSVPTIFELARMHGGRAIDIDVPAYSEQWFFGLPRNHNECFADFISRSLKDALDRFNYTKKKVLALLQKEKNWDLLMMYTKLLDTYGELSFGPKLNQMYFMVNDFAKKVESLLDESFMLIISDHGIERLGETSFGKHSDYAFYSIDRKMGLKNPKITDFYFLIKNILEGQIHTNLSAFQTT